VLDRENDKDEMNDFVLQGNNSRYSFGKSRKTELGNLMAPE